MSEKKKTGFLWLLALTSIVILLLTLRNTFNQEKQEEGILKVQFNKEEKLVNLIDFLINPGDVIEYSVVTDAKKTTNAKVEVWFKGVDDHLNDALLIYCKYNNTQETKKESITDYTSANRLTFTTSFDTNLNYFNLYFEMPFEEVGNEYQNVSCEFETYIKVTIDD